MSKAEFFMQMEERLRGLSNEEKQRIIRIYKDLFRQAEDSGKSEQEIVKSLGFVSVPAPVVPALPRAGERYAKTAKSGFRAVIASISLGLFNLMFVLGPFIGITAILFSLSLVSVLFTFSSFWIILGTGLPVSLTILMLEIFSALSLTGLGVLLGIGMWKVNIGYGKLVKRYVALNIKMIKGE